MKIKKIEFENIVKYVAINKKSILDLKDFYFIESGFRKFWNKNPGKIAGDGDIKNAVYRFLENEMKKEAFKKAIPQKKVDTTIDLILDYMESVNQWNANANEVVLYSETNIYCPKEPNLKEVLNDPKIIKGVKDFENYLNKNK